MGTINFYRRYKDDGSCETICTRCFSTAGPARERAEIERIEAAHSCSTTLPAPGGGSLGGRREARIPAGLHPAGLCSHGQMRAVDALLLLFSMVLCLYLLPDVVELEMIKHITFGVSVILFGDLVGCCFLSLGLGWRKTGAALYLALTACEVWIRMDRIASRHALLWLTDLIPTVACVAAFLLFRSRPLRAVNAGRP